MQTIFGYSGVLTTGVVTSIVAEFDGTGALIARFVYGTRPNVPDYMIKGGELYRIVTDHLGSVRLVVRASDGVVVQEITYDPWGKVLTDTSSGFQPFGFAGGLYDPETGLVRFGARDYDAETGRWTAKDPSLFAGGSNLYEYAAGNPVNYVDLTGKFPLPPTAITAAAVGFGAGFVGNLIPQLFAKAAFGSCVSLEDAFVAGVVGGATGYLAFKNAPMWLLGALGNGLQYWITEKVHGREAKWDAAIRTAALGFAAGVLGGLGPTIPKGAVYYAEGRVAQTVGGKPALDPVLATQLARTNGFVTLLGAANLFVGVATFYVFQFAGWTVIAE